MILMHEDWHRDTLGRSWDIYRLRSTLSLSLCSRLGWVRHGRRVSQSIGNSRNPTSGFLGERRVAHHMYDRAAERIIRSNPVPDDSSLSLTLHPCADCARGTSVTWVMLARQ